MKWRTASAPMFDSVSGGGPKFKIEAPKAPKPDMPPPQYGGPGTRGLKDWDEPTPKAPKERIVRQPQPGKLLHRLRRPDGTALEARLVATVASRTAITDAHPDADLPKSGSLVNLPVGPHVRVIKHWKLITKMIDTAPKPDNYDRVKAAIMFPDGRVVQKSTSVLVKMDARALAKLRASFLDRSNLPGTYYPGTK